MWVGFDRGMPGSPVFQGKGAFDAVESFLRQPAAAGTRVLLWLFEKHRNSNNTVFSGFAAYDS